MSTSKREAKKKKKREKRRARIRTSRLVFVLLAMLLQVIWIVLTLWILKQHYTAVSAAMQIFALLTVLRIYWGSDNAAFKMPWMILIMVFPVLGISMYLMMGRPNLNRRAKKRFGLVEEEVSEELVQEVEVQEALRRENLCLSNQSEYLWRYSHFPLYRNTEITFYDDASKGLAAQMEALRRAENFIFMEYHAFEDAEAFGPVREILYEKAAAGVTVRLIYDDMGSLSFVGREFPQKMREHGIECHVFNPVRPFLNSFINNRDHKKVTVVDGKVGFTGGYNMTDEYFNIIHPYGHWKDTGVRLEGDAVRSLSAMFLEMWDAIEKTDPDYERFLSVLPGKAEAEGYVQPFADTPMDREPVGENVYMNIIKSAERYVYFMTPYLIISDEMRRELELAAKRGVDVRIITPGIPDKKIVYNVTRSYYEKLLESGVRIFEYTPGFCHGKQCVSDGRVSVVGTINLDYRSLYLHFEDAVFFCGCPAVADVKQDFENTFAECREVIGERQPFRVRLWRGILRLFAPMM